MSRAEIIDALSRVKSLSDEIDVFAPPDQPKFTEFRADLAGLLNVMVCATYENCVKSVIFDFTSRHHALFGSYAQVRYDKINSKISLGDLYNYADTFHPKIGKHFREKFKSCKSYYLKRTSINIEESYSQILRWRHTFAHTGTRVTTVEEVITHHKVAKRTVLLFSDSFSIPI